MKQIQISQHPAPWRHRPWHNHHELAGQSEYKFEKRERFPHLFSTLDPWKWLTLNQYSKSPSSYLDNPVLTSRISRLQFYIQFASLSTFPNVLVLIPHAERNYFAAFLYYDYCLTFSMEVKYIWSRRFRFSTLLYFCCRYGLVANVIYVLSFANRMKVRVCHTMMEGN